MTLLTYVFHSQTFGKKGDKLQSYALLTDASKINKNKNLFNKITRNLLFQYFKPIAQTEDDN